MDYSAVICDGNISCNCLQGASVKIFKMVLNLELSKTCFYQAKHPFSGKSARTKKWLDT